MYKAFGVSLRGKAHVMQDLPNQDCFFCTDGLAVVSDGVGSAEFSHIGSEAAVEAVAAAYASKQQDAAAFLRSLHEHWLARINPCMADKYASTCLFAADLDGQILLGRLGDGIIAVLGKNPKNDFIMEECKENSYANMTDALRFEFRANSWETRCASNVAAVVLCTDGISNRLLDDKKIEFFRHIYENALELPKRELQAWAEAWVGQWRSGTGDDKTVAFLLNRGNTRERSKGACRRIQQKSRNKKTTGRRRLRQGLSYNRRKNRN